ncbi:MAG: hypothetical protein ABH851_06555 [Methanobacteriota archaeon]
MAGKKAGKPKRRHREEPDLKAMIDRSMREFDLAWREFFKDRPKPRTEEENLKQQREFAHWYNNVRKQSDTGKSPAEMGERIIEFRVDEEPGYVPIKELLAEETSETKKLETIYMREEDYAHILEPVESMIVEYWLDNPKTTDKQVAKALKKFLKNPFKEYDSSKKLLEYGVQYALSVGLQEQAATRNELNAVIEYLLWSIDNRSWMRDKQAYLKWLAAFLGYIDRSEIDNPIVPLMMDYTDELSKKGLEPLSLKEQLAEQKKSVEGF